jgi:rifampicin phosphotransferase
MEARWLTDWAPSVRFPVYTRANAGEVLPTPASPLGQQFTWERGICLGWRDGYVRQGLYTGDEFDPVNPDVCGFFGSYVYVNLANVRMQGVRSPLVTVAQLDLAFFGDHPDVPPYVPDPRDERPELVPGIMEHVGWVLSTTSWPEIDEEREQTIGVRRARPDLTALDDTELVARARSMQPMLVKLFESHTLSSSSSGVAPGVLGAVGAAIGDPTIAMTLLAGIGDVDSAEPGYEMWELSRLVRSSSSLTASFDGGVGGLLERLRTDDAARDFVERFDRFLAEHGCRGPNEWEISAETWETNPTIALAAIDRVRFQDDGESPHVRNRRRAAEREALTAEVRARVAPLGTDLVGQFEAGLVASHQLAFRERTKTNIIRIVHEVRMVFRELARRHAATGALADPADVFMLLEEEVEAFIVAPSSFTDTLAERAATWHRLWELEPPYFIVGGVVPPLTRWARRGEATAPPAAAGDVIHGVAGCPGVVTGRARIVTDPSDPGELEPGDILVAPLTDPAWTPLFMAVAGAVIDVGGQISHAIIVSRELGLPCVVSATGATARILEGSLIEVDGQRGTVTVLEVPA